MMLDIKLEEIYDNSTRYIPFGFFIGILLIFEISIIAQDSTLPLLSIHNNILLDSSIISFTNIEVLGNYLYTDGFYQFLISSLVLLVAMIGAIVLTLYHSPEVRRQDLFSQVSTDYMETVKLRKNVIA
jgi:NADH:ubiquinone oxidoreductase subunit 6 (subunit J)